MTEKLNEKEKEYLCKVESYGFKLIGSYKGLKQKSRVEFECKKGHIESKTLNSLFANKSCGRCYLLKGYYEMSKILIEEGCKVITKEEDFKNSEVSKIEYICINGHTQKSNIYNLRKGKRCKKCAIDRNSKKRRRTHDDIIELVEELGYKFNNLVGEYVNRDSLISITCDNGHTYETKIAYIYEKRRCITCRIDNSRGENHYLWNGGLRDLRSYIRSNLHTWKKDSLETSNYTCFITNKKGQLEIHHSVNFTNILLETLTELNLDLLQQVKDYGENLNNIVELCIKKHYEYGLGIVMLKDIHRLFHKVYGIKNNTMEQVLEFKQDYLNGKYNDILSA